MIMYCNTHIGCLGRGERVPIGPNCFHLSCGPKHSFYAILGMPAVHHVPTNLTYFSKIENVYFFNRYRLLLQHNRV